MNGQHGRNTSDDFVAAIALRGVTKRYGGRAVVDNLSFVVEPGTITGFLGPNGAGKSTTMRVLLGLAAPSNGEALVLGCRYGDLDHPAHRVGAVLEADGFHPGRGARDHLRTLAVAGEISDEQVDRVLAVVELERAAEQRVGTFSLGMRQRLALAGALLGDPSVLVLDEPANGLDVVGVRWLRRTLRAFADRGGAVLVSSHALDEIGQTADAVVIINAGRLVATIRIDDLATRDQSLEDAYVELLAAQAA